MSQVEPMTAAEYGVLSGLLTPGTSGRQVAERLLAALEERERLLGEREAKRFAGRRTSVMSAVLEVEADNVKEGYGFNVEGRVKLLRDAAQRVRELEDELSGWEENAVKQSTDASLGALVRRIREHPMATEITRLNITVGGPRTDWGEEFLREALSHLDSLLPKEPEVAPSGWRYKWSDGEVLQVDHVGQETPITDGPTDEMVPPCDAPVVAALMEASRAK